MSITETFTAAVAKQVKANNGTSWGAGDSLAVSEAITDAAYLDGESPIGFDGIRGLMSELINPSQFRQKLEKLDATNPCHVRPTGNKRGQGSSVGIAALKAGLGLPKTVAG